MNVIKGEKMKLKPVTIDDVRNSEDRGEAKRRYAKWRDKQRKQDKRNLEALKSRIYRFKNQEKMKAIRDKSNRRHNNRCKDCNKPITDKGVRCKKCANQAYLRKPRFKFICANCKEQSAGFNTKAKYCSKPECINARAKVCYKRRKNEQKAKL